MKTDHAKPAGIPSDFGETVAPCKIMQRAPASPARVIEMMRCVITTHTTQFLGADANTSREQ
ncbi:MAG: hypothetical protein ACRDT1_16760, partial [Micromonosporaceae bacterium]